MRWLLVGLIFLFVLFASGCGEKRCHHVVVLADLTTSATQANSVINAVNKAFDDWTQDADPGDQFDVWVLTPNQRLVAQSVKTIIFPELKIPTDKTRPEYSSRIQGEISAVLAENQKELVGVKGSPILEGISEIGDQTKDYKLLIFTDCLQDSPGLTFYTLDNDESADVAKMVTASRWDNSKVVKPDSVEVHWLYGASDDHGPISLKKMEDVRDRWQKFFSSQNVSATMDAISVSN